MSLLSIFSAILCNCGSLVFLQTFITIIFSGGNTDYKYANSLGFIMPVTTRSQARLLSGKCNESAQVCLPCSPLPSAVSTSHDGPLTKYMSRPSSFNNISTSLPTSTSPISPSTDSSFVALDHSSTPMPSPHFKFGNLKSVDSASSVSISNYSIVSSSCIHYSEEFENFTMEADCQDDGGDTPPSSSPDLQVLLASLSTTLSNHISSQTAIIQDKMSQNNLKLQQSQAVFKQEVRSELDEFCALMEHQQRWIESRLIDSSSRSTPVSPPPAQPSPSIVPVPTSAPAISHSSGQDLQAQMLLLLTESFSKLSTALTDNKSDSKADWHKFIGDSSKFCAWYLGIMAHLSLPPWSDLYDSSSNDVVSTTSNSALNGKLYSKVLLALDGSAYQSFVSRKHLRANGIQLLRELVKTYKLKNVPEIIAAKTAEFWGSTKRSSSESIDSYYNRFQELLDDLADADEPIAPKAAIRQFIFTSGSEFETIQNNFRINNLPPAWQTQDWPTLLTLCRDFYNSVKPQATTRRQTSGNSTLFDRESHQKKVKEWFMNPSKFGKEIAACQKLHQGECIYHLSKTHPTESCFVKTECDKIIASKKPTGNQNDRNQSTTGQLRHIVEEEEFVPEDLDDCVMDSLDSIPNNTNEETLFYFARMSNHYLRLINASE